MAANKPDYSSNAPAMVTGATGYLAGWIIKRLLEQGKTVHAAIRDPSHVGKLVHLNTMAASLPGQIKYFKADLLEHGSYEEAMVGCDTVFHTASPFTSKITDPQTDLVDPAVEGTTNVLNSVNANKSVKRVVLTSSCASIYGDARDISSAPDGILTEEQWNTTSRLDHQSYSFSKVEAERAAWKIADAQQRWELVVVNPSLIVGPGTADTQTSESFTIVRQLGDGTLKSGVPSFDIGVVDVRDVAEAHLRAAFIANVSGRHIVSAKGKTLMQLSQILRSKFGDKYPFPKSTIPKWLVWLVGPLANKAFTREMIAKNVGYRWRADNSKSIEALGLVYRPIEDAIIEMFQQLIETDQVKST